MEQDGVLALSSEQRTAVDRHIQETLAALAARFDTDTTESQKQISWGMRIASTIGGLALCAAVVLFFYRYWGALATPVQVAVLALTPAALGAAAPLASRRERTPYFTSLIVMVAFAAFVMNLAVLGVIFNLAPAPGAWLAWGLFGLALAYRFGLRLPLAAGLLCLIVWFGALVTGWAGNYWAAVAEFPEPLVAAGAAVFAVALFPRHAGQPEFPAAYRLVGLFAVFLPVLAMGLGISASYLPMTEKHVGAFYQLAGMAVAAAGVWFGVRRYYSGVVNASAAFFAVFLFCRFGAWWWDWMPKYLFFLVVGLVALGMLAAFGLIRTRGKL